MSRLIMPSAMSAETAERISDVARVLSPAEQQSIHDRATEIIWERLNDEPRLKAMVGEIDFNTYWPYLHRAMMHIDNARSNDPIAIAHVLAAVEEFANLVHYEAELVWRESAMQEAEKELWK